MLLQTLITAHNRWLPKARSVSFLDYKRPFFHCCGLFNFLAADQFTLSLTGSLSDLYSNCRINESSTLSLSFILRSTVSRPVYLGIKYPPGAYDQIFIFVICGFVDVGRSLWREDGSVVYNCSWSSPVESFSGPSLIGLVMIFCCLRFENSLFVASYGSQGNGEGIRPRLHTGVASNLSGKLLSFHNVPWTAYRTLNLRFVFLVSVVTDYVRVITGTCLAKPLASTERSSWLHYPGFQESYHSILPKSVLNFWPRDGVGDGSWPWFHVGVTGVLLNRCCSSSLCSVRPDRLT
jgi:hypothetical protein